MGVDVTDAITPSPSPAGTAVRKLRNSPARAAAQAYSATMICTTTNGQKVGLWRVFTAEVTTPVAIHTPRPASALRAAHLHDASRAELLQLACDRLRGWGAPFTSVYAYMLHDGELVLEAFSGRETEHTRIPVGRGVCGTAVATGEDQNVPDVA